MAAITLLHPLACWLTCPCHNLDTLTWMSLRWIPPYLDILSLFTDLVLCAPSSRPPLSLPWSFT